MHGCTGFSFACSFSHFLGTGVLGHHKGHQLRAGFWKLREGERGSCSVFAHAQPGTAVCSAFGSPLTSGDGSRGQRLLLSSLGGPFGDTFCEVPMGGAPVAHGNDQPQTAFLNWLSPLSVTPSGSLPVAPGKSSPINHLHANLWLCSQEVQVKSVSDHAGYATFA